MADLEVVEQKIIEQTLTAAREKNELAEKVERKDKQKLVLAIFLLVVTIFSMVWLVVYVLSQWQPPPPQVVTIDSRTGIVTNVQEFKGEDSFTVSERTAIVRSYTNQMVLSRYNYSYSENTKMLKDQYSIAAAFLKGKTLTDFTQEVHAANPQSSIQRFGEIGVADTFIRNIILLDKDRVQVEFESNQKSSSGTSNVYSFTGIGRFVWNDYEGLDEQQKRVNPLGFRFLDWNITQNASSSVSPQPNSQTVEDTN